MNNQLTNAINLLHDSKISSNLSNEQIKAIAILEGAYLDLQLEYTNKLSRRNMQIKELRKELKEAYISIADLTHPEYKDK